MDTLSNVNKKREDEVISQDVGFTSKVPLKKPDISGEVAVKYVPDVNKRWFVLRVTYGRERKAYDFIMNDHTEAYLPMCYVQKIYNGKKKRIELHYLTYYYNHFKVGEFGKNPPLTVGYNEMMNFIRVTSLNNEHVRLVESQHCHYKSGDKVRIVDGDFAGVEGKVARVAGQQRVVIELPGVCLVATAYIPTAFIKPIPSVSEK